MNITYQTKSGILEVKPTGALEEQDFQHLAAEIRSLREDGRELRGLLIRTKDFPGYEEFADMVAHGKFIAEHRDKIAKVALCTDSKVGNLLELIGKTVTEAKVKKFGYDEQDDAEKWILT